MSASNEQSHFLTAFHAAIDGQTPTHIAACGMPAVVKLILDLAAKLGRLDRGTPVTFDASECAVLFQVFSHAAKLSIERRCPETLSELVSAEMMLLAFNSHEPEVWADCLIDAIERRCTWRVPARRRNPGDRLAATSRIVHKISLKCEHL
jgi:hypothetical protein